MWFGEAVVCGRYWLDSGLVGYLEEVRVMRGRMGWYEVMNFVLLLNVYTTQPDGGAFFVFLHLTSPYPPPSSAARIDN
ncbi:hypothetical protein NDI45_24345 [Leptolyngbya sp. GB1-A1]|uniref:hypothetical protein n=1 Tax=Leptolyngbya sp. GB1-A1 TaxID=2933908 RepID=UPI0032985C8F